MEGVKDVQGGSVRASAPGLHGGGDEHAGGCPSVRSAPGYGAQDAGVLGASRFWRARRCFLNVAAAFESSMKLDRFLGGCIAVILQEIPNGLPSAWIKTSNIPLSSGVVPSSTAANARS